VNVEEDVWACPACAWGLPLKYTKKYQEEEKEREEEVPNLEASSGGEGDKKQ
jgi:hypothetical protein